MRIAHLAFDLRFRRQRRNRVDDDDIDGTGTHQHVGNLERLLTRVGLRNQQLVDIDAELLGIDRVERMLGIDKGGRAALLLRLGNDLQRQRGLARGLRPVDLHHSAPWEAANAQCNVEADRTRGDGLDVPGRLGVPHAHDRALAELFFDLAEGLRECFLAIVVHIFGPFGAARGRFERYCGFAQYYFMKAASIVAFR